jgi:alkanesulfonate monooxygenase SsuD/methylene tetrahydromethanopterin reductase-like flavin-dependent oxidoreductase (luciferase family)
MSLEFAINVPSSAGVGGHKDHPFWPKATWDDIRNLAERADAAGFDTIAFPDHFTIGEGTTFECFSTLSALAMVTEDAMLYPKVVNSLFRNPGLLAKTGATFDTISGGRLKMGLGAGWVGSEMTAYGYEWPDPVERIRRMEETAEILKRLWTGSTVDYDGEYYSLEEATCRPQPRQSPRPPIVIGGGGEKFTLRVVARHADSWNWIGPFDGWEHKRDVLTDHCEEEGRDVEDIEKSWFGRVVVRETESEARDLVERAEMFDSFESAREEHLVGTPAQVGAQLNRLAEMGLDEIVVEFVDVPDQTGLRLFADEVMPSFH